MNQQQAVISNLKIALPAEDLVFVVSAASGASLRREDWRRLEAIDKAVADLIAQAAERVTPDKAVAPFDPSTPQAAAARAARRASRQEESAPAEGEDQGAEPSESELVDPPPAPE